MRTNYVKLFAGRSGWRRSLWLAAFAGAAAASAHAAEDFERIAPKQPTSFPAPRPSVPVQGKVAKGSPDQVLVAHLNALVFVPTPNAVVTTGLVDHGIDLKKVTVPAPEHFASVVMPYLGKPVTHAKLNDLVQAIIVYYREHARPVVDVAVPAQDITNGVLQVVLLEARVGKVTVEGNRWFSSSQIRDGVSLREGGPIDSEKLETDLDFLNQNPFRSTDVIYRPGEKLGETDVTLKTQDRFPARVFAGYEDSGDVETGIDRYFVGFNYGDLFRLGQQVNYQYTTTSNFQNLRAQSGSYVIPLPWEHTLTFFGSYVDTKGNVPGFAGLTGRTYQISGRYSVPLPTLTVARVSMKESASAGFDYKYVKDSLEFGNLATDFGTASSNTLYDIDQFVLSYDAVETDPWGRTSVDESLFISPGNWGGNNNDAQFFAAHTFATSGYVYNTLNLERLTKLPGDWSLVLRGVVQSSNSNLVASEQLGLGGYDTVRGYDEREVNTDDGFVFSTEIRTPTISLGDTLGYAPLKDQLQFLGFWDYGDGSNHTSLPGETNEIPLSSLGVGLRYAINTYLSVRYDYAFQLLRTGFDNDHGSRSDLGVVISY
jgi:hemolysin activation/secretion protein